MKDFEFRHDKIQEILRLSAKTKTNLEAKSASMSCILGDVSARINWPEFGPEHCSFSSGKVTKFVKL
jgi:hypothetical protein